LEHQVFRFAKMILRDRRSTSYDLASLFRGGRNTSDRWSGKSLNVLVRGCQRCTQLSIFEGSLRELLRFCFCQLWKLRTSHRIPSFLTLSKSKLRKSRRIAPFLMLPNFLKMRMPRRKISFSSLQKDRWIDL
jgi:hypothetical protein